MAIVGWMKHGRNDFRNYHLMNGSPALSVVAICGEPGSGKTTLARLLYHDPAVSHRFKMRAWFNVGKACNVRDLLENLLCSLTSGLEANEMIEPRMDGFQLQQMVWETLSRRRYLIVLDDVCCDIWGGSGALRSALPNSNNGSRIIVTASSQDFVRNMDYAYIQHDMRLLSEDEMWELFCKLTDPEDEDSQLGLGNHYDKIKRIIRTCCRLPLAIVVIAGMVKSSQDLDKMLFDMQGKSLEELLEILRLSYVMLPVYLKPCMRYLGQFPPEKEISVEKMCLLWMAEGQISTNRANGTTELDEAKSYYNELIACGLVIEGESDGVSSSSQRFASCKLPRSIHTMCREESSRKDLLRVLDADNKNLTGDSPWRLAIYLDEFEDINILRNIQGTKRVKSVLFFDSINRTQSNFTGAIDLEKFKSTEVLEFNGVNFREEKCQGLEKLKRLKYLSFQGCNLVELPASIRKCLSLETLDLGVIDSCKMFIPDVLQKLSMLKHLYLPLNFRCATGKKLKLDKLKGLVILENFHSEKCDSKDLTKLTKLQSLTCIGVGNIEDLRNILNAMNRIHTVMRLHHTSLVVEGFEDYPENTIHIVEEMFNCSGIHFLDIGYIGPLPTLHRVGSNFTKMVIKQSGFDFDPMPQLGGLPNLTSLVLSEDAFRGEKLVFRGGSFPKLRSLQLEVLHRLNELELELEGERKVLPCLATLTIKYCDELINLPEGLADISSLEKLITNHSMIEEFQRQVNNINYERERKGYKFLSIST